MKYEQLNRLDSSHRIVSSNSPENYRSFRGVYPTEQVELMKQIAEEFHFVIITLANPGDKYTADSGYRGTLGKDSTYVGIIHQGDTGNFFSKLNEMMSASKEE